MPALVPETDGRPTVVVFRALPGLGDLLCTVPALRALRAALPGAHVALLGLPEARPVLDRVGPYVDELLPFAGWPGVVESPTQDARRITDGLRLVQERRFDLAVQMHGSGVVTNPFTALLGARAMAGFHLPGQWCPDPDRFVPYPASQPEVRRHLALMAGLGVPVHGEELELRLLPADVEEADGVARAAGLEPGGYACVNAGATVAARRWPPERFAAVGDALAAEGLAVVLTGTPEERCLTARVAAAMRAPAVDLAGATSLGGLAGLVAGSRLTVTNDTGTSHLAAALHVPSVVVFCASDPHRWAPLDRSRHRVVAHPSLLDDAHRDACAGSGRCLRDGCVALDGCLPEVPPPDVGQVVQAALELSDV